MMKPFKETVNKLISDIKSNRCWTLSLREAFSYMPQKEINLINRCIYRRDEVTTITRLVELVESYDQIYVVAEFPGGEQHRLPYAEFICMDVLREYHHKGIKAWIELD